MNLFELQGPQYLVFFTILTAFVAAVVMVVRSMVEGSQPARGDARSALTDPYLIAFLRTGKAAVIRTAAVSLVDRGLLQPVADELRVTAVGVDSPPRKPVERALLSACSTPNNATALLGDPGIDVACRSYEQRLVDLGLLPDAAIKTKRGLIFIAAIAILAFFSLTKMAIGLSRGRPILFLMLLSIGALILIAAVSFSHRTARGDTLMKELKNLFWSLRVRAARIEPGGANADLALLVAVFGVDAAEGQTGWTKKVFRKSTSSDGSSASCGSSCGSSCGGGGCGGGCGGCGS